MLPLQVVLGELLSAQQVLAAEGLQDISTWADLAAGSRPPLLRENEPGDWPHGWQFHASSQRVHFFRRTSVLPCYSASACAHSRALGFRAHSGPNSGSALSAPPMGNDLAVDPFLFRTLLLERLRLPLLVTEAVCEECGAPLDVNGRHRAACPLSGCLKTRAAPMQRVIARVCREAGATVRLNTMLKDMNVGVKAGDERRIEVLAQGLPLHGGAQLVVDATVRSLLTCEGHPCPRADREDGAVLLDARLDEEDAHPELLKAVPADGGFRC